MNIYNARSKDCCDSFPIKHCPPPICPPAPPMPPCPCGIIGPTGPTGPTGSSITGPTGPTGAAAGFGKPTASVDSNVGTPSVTVTASGSNTSKVFNFAFKNLKG